MGKPGTVLTEFAHGQEIARHDGIKERQVFKPGIDSKFSKCIA